MTMNDLFLGIKKNTFLMSQQRQNKQKLHQMSILLAKGERRCHYNLLDVHDAKFVVLKLVPIFHKFLMDDGKRDADVLVHTVLYNNCDLMGVPKWLSFVG